MFPETGAAIEPVTGDELIIRFGTHGRLVRNAGEIVGAITVERDDPPSRSETQLLDDLAGQAGLVLQHLDLTALVAPRRSPGDLDMTPREREVLELMARGCSNSAICAELHLSVKTIEPVISAIFTKLGLRHDTRNNRRVLAVVTYLGVAPSNGPGRNTDPQT